MKLLRSIAEMRSASREARAKGALGFVPTMGALHQGHLSLVRAARAQCSTVAASIFVNPTQFGPNEDFKRYPRDLEQDCKLLHAENVDLVFVPSAEEMYPAGPTTFVEVGELANKLCGRSRSGHFRGVATVVAKLFNIVAPDRAYFGQKDAAQVTIIRKLVRDLHFPVEIVACPIVRESDGLAMSSRNAYLDPAQRKQAVVLQHTLVRIQRLFQQGQRSVAQLTSAGQQMLTAEPALKLDYLEFVDQETLDPLSTAAPGTLVAVAGFFGSTRLIDNVILQQEAQLLETNPLPERK